MAGVSAASVLLFWYIVAIAAPLRSVCLQLAAIVTFAFSPALAYYRFDTETIAFAQLGLLGALAAIAKQRYAWAAVAGFGMFCARADTAGLLALLWGVSIWSAYAGSGSGNEGRADFLRVAAVIAGAVALYMSYHLLVFRSPVPPGTGVAPSLIDGLDLYRYRAFWSGPNEALERRLNLDYFEARARVALDALQQAELSKDAHVWLFLALVPRISGAAGGHLLARLCPWMLVLGAFLIAWSSPAVFAAFRAPCSLLPVLVLAGAYGAESLIDQLERGVARVVGRAPPLSSSAGVASSAATSSVRVVSTQVSSALASSALAYALTSSAAPYEKPVAPPVLVDELLAVHDRLGSRPVMSLVPWYVLAYTDSPAVMLPFNGEQAIAEVIERYDVEWLLLLRSVGALEGSALVVQQLWAKSRSQIGQHELHEVERTNERLLYRVFSAESGPKVTAIRRLDAPTHPSNAAPAPAPAPGAMPRPLHAAAGVARP
jgi:hypothetical protein